MPVNVSLRFFGTRPPALQQRAGVAAYRSKTKQAAMLLQIRHCIVRSRIVALGRVKQASSYSIEELDAKQKRQISLFVHTLLDWNQHMNLTAVTERDAVMERHVADSLALLPNVESAYSAHCLSSDTFDERLKVVDVGSGAGLPGLILAIARPGAPHTVGCQIQLPTFLVNEDRAKFTFRESGTGVKVVNLNRLLMTWRSLSCQKRCYFLEYAAEQSGLSNVTIVRARAEDCGRDERFRGAYDVAMARAVAEMRVLSELCLPLVRVGGLFVAAKGPDPQQEVDASRSALRVLGASLLSISTVASEGPLGLRTAVVCHKQKPTPAKYPRSVGTPGKHPL